MAEAYVTLATNDTYAVGSLVLAHSLKEVKTSKQLCILITPEVSSEIRSKLDDVYNNVVTVNVLDSNDSAHLALLKRPELGVTLTKIHCWSLIQYSKCVFLDADILAVKNADELFEQRELSAACDVGWPDCFNSGMFVFSPSLETYGKLLKQVEEHGSFDGGDQGLLNSYFKDWNKVSFIYNMVSSATYTYIPAYKEFGQDVKFVHFLGSRKPWHSRSQGESQDQGSGQNVSDHLNTWWKICETYVTPDLSQEECHKHTINTPANSFESQENDFSHPNEQSDFSMQVHDRNQQFPHSISAEPKSIDFSLSSFSDPSTYPCSSQETPQDHNIQDDSTNYEDIPRPTSPCKSTITPYISHSSPDNKDENIPIPVKCENTPVIIPKDTPQYTINEPPCNIESSLEHEESTVCTSSDVGKAEVSIQSVGDTIPLKDSNHSNIGRPISESSRSMAYPPMPNPVGGFQPIMNTRMPSPYSFSRPSQLVMPFVDYANELSQCVMGLNIQEQDAEEGRKRWETGTPDYLGRDSFDNIQAYIDAKLDTP